MMMNEEVLNNIIVFKSPPVKTVLSSVKLVGDSGDGV